MTDLRYFCRLQVDRRLTIKVERINRIPGDIGGNKMIKGLLFDLDNTLMDRDWTFQEFSRQLVRELLSEQDQEKQEQIVAYMIESDADGYRPKDGFFLELIDRLPWRVKPVLSEVQAYYNEHYMKHARVMAHTLDTLNACREAGFKLGVITNGLSAVQHGKIDRLELRDYFDAIIVSGDHGMKKPDQQIYELALKRLGTAAEETLIIGDHPVNDIWGASRAGIRGIWLKRKHAWPETMTDATPLHAVLELDEVVAILKNLQTQA